MSSSYTFHAILFLFTLHLFYLTQLDTISKSIQSTTYIPSLLGKWTNCASIDEV
jgi:hypothetical protein